MKYFEDGYNNHLLGCYTTIRDLAKVSPIYLQAGNVSDVGANNEWILEMYHVAFGVDYTVVGGSPSNILYDREHLG